MRERTSGPNVYDEMNGPTKKIMSTFDIAGALNDHILPKTWICLIYFLCFLLILRINISAKYLKTLKPMNLLVRYIHVLDLAPIFKL